MTTITIPVPVPYGQDGVISIYVRKTDGSEKNITYYHYSHKINQKLNTLWSFNLDLVGVSQDDKDTWIVKNHEILIFWGTQIRMKGRIEKVTYDSHEKTHIEGVGMAVKLRDRDVEAEYLNENSDSIIKKLVSRDLNGISPWLMSIDTNTNYGLTSMHFSSDNRLRSLAGTVQAIDYDWWEDWKSADDYVTNYINVDDFKGDSTSTAMTFYTSGTNQNMKVLKNTEDTYESCNTVTVLGYGDGLNQLKAISFHATEDRTILNKPLDAILNGDINGETEDLVVYDSSGFDIGDTIRIDGEEMTITALPSSTQITVAARTGKPSHTTNAEVIKTAGKIHCVDTTSLPASGNVWIGQEKISYSANASNDLTITSREVDFLVNRIKKAYYHGSGIEVYDAQYTKDSPDNPSYINTDGVRSRTFTDTSIISQNLLDYISQRIRIDRQEEIAIIKVEAIDAFDVLVTNNLQVGDWIELSDTFTGFSTGTRYEVVGMIYGFNTEKGEYCEIEVSNYNRTLLENSIKETDNLGKYYKGATNIYQVNDHDNCDGDGTIDSAADFPLVIPFYIPPDAVAINKVLLSYKIEDYRRYFDTNIPSGGGATSGAGGGTTKTSSDNYGNAGSYAISDTATDSIIANNTWDNILSEIVPSGKGKAGIIVNYTIDPSALTADTRVDVRINIDDTYYYPLSGGIVPNIDRDSTIDGVFDGTVIILQDVESSSVDLEVRHHTGSGGESITAGWTINDIKQHNHDITLSNHTHSTPDHTHTVTYEISEVSKSLTDVQISIDNGDGTGYVDKTVALEGLYGVLNTSQEQNLDITDYIGREPGWKGVRIHTDGKCRIRGDIYVQVFVQSKT